MQIYKLIKEQNLTQTKAAELLSKKRQAQVSALMRCRPVSVSVGRLMEFLTILSRRRGDCQAIADAHCGTFFRRRSTKLTTSHFHDGILSTFSGQLRPPKGTTPVRPPLRAVSLFSGAGGFCEGVRLAG